MMLLRPKRDLTMAEAARAPGGETYTITGILEASSCLTIVRIDSERPPGVSRMITAAL